MMKTFSEICKCAFVCDDKVTAEEVLSMLKPVLPQNRQDMNEDETRIMKFLTEFVNQIDEKGN